MPPNPLPRAITRGVPALASLATLVLVVAMALVAGALTPDYDHVSQYISELGATGAPYQTTVRFAGFLPAGLSMLIFCAAAYRQTPPSWGAALGWLGLAVFAAGYLVAAAFPCDPGCRPAVPSTSQLIHNAGGGLGYLVAPASLFALALAARGWPRAGYLVVAGQVASRAALCGLLALSPSSPTAGFGQRVLELAVLGWSVLCGLYLSTTADPRPSRGPAPR